MAKINSTFNGNYYLAHDVDYQKLDEMEQKASKRARREGTAGERVMRQTFAIPFNLICTSCSKRVVRGTHGYMNRTKAKEKYLGLAMYNIACKCPYCGSGFVLRTDLETAKLTGGYKCISGCRRVEGDFFAQNLLLEAEKKEAAAAKILEQSKSTSHDDFSAFNAKMEAVRTRNQQIDEFVEAKKGLAHVGEGTLKESLLRVVRTDPVVDAAAQHDDDKQDELADDDDHVEDDEDEFDFDQLQQKIRDEVGTNAANAPNSGLTSSAQSRGAGDDDAVPASVMTTSSSSTLVPKRSRFDISITEAPGVEAQAPAPAPAQSGKVPAPKKRSGALASLADYS